MSSGGGPARSCSDTVSAPTSIRKVWQLMLLSFFQCRHHYPALASFHWSALFRRFLLIIHHILIHLLLENRTNIQRIVTLVCLHARSYRDRWLHVSIGIAEPKHKGLTRAMKYQYQLVRTSRRKKACAVKTSELHKTLAC